jgi:hypothetical protein
MGRKTGSYITQSKTYQIPVINNRYDLFSLSEGCGSETNSVNEVQQIKGRRKYNRKIPDIKKNKIIILGDCHTRGCVHEVQHNLWHDFAFQGIVKPGANMEIIVNTSSADTGKLTKKNVVVGCGGARGVGRNETVKGLYLIKSFVENNKQTNVIVMSAPYRHDLESKILCE